MEADYWKEPQDLGEDFHFEEDGEALQSILQNKGLVRPQGHAEPCPKRCLEPAEVVPNNFQESNQLEFFQSVNGKVFFRQKTVSPRRRFVMKNNTTPSMQPVRFLSARKPLSATKTPVCLDGQCNSIGKLFPVRLRPCPGKTSSAQKATTAGLIPPLHRQSISERKPLPAAAATRLPQPAGSLARKSLHFLGGGGQANETKPEFKKPLLPPAAPLLENPLPPLTQLTRESMQYLPRDSLAWLSQLPRESATFAELAGLMGEGDRDLMNEDDTQSFEALEMRLRTPCRPAPKSKVAVELDAAVMSPSVGTPASQRKQSLEFQTLLNSGPKTVEEELVNLPADPILSTPTIKSRSCSDLSQSGDLAVLRSGSEDNLAKVVQLSELVCSERLDHVLRDLEHYRQEQNELERQQQELSEKIRKRKAEFKELWGVSPMRINQLRTVAKAAGVRDQEEREEDKENQCPIEEHRRRVRFNSGDNMETFLTPGSSFQATPSSLPKSTNNSFSNQSLASLKLSFSFLQTPSHSANRRSLRQYGGSSALRHSDGLVVPTPVALRSLSDRVKEELALLYADSSDETEELSGAVAQTLHFAE